MKNQILTVAVLLFTFFSSNISNAQYGIEVNYGLNGSIEPSINNISHYGVGLHYDFDDVFGVKLDFGSDKFRSNNELSGIESGVDISRFSVQGKMNISNLIDNRSNYRVFNLNSHAGLGYSIVKSTLNPYTDNVVNFIGGLTPTFKVATGLYFIVDTSLIFNVSQHNSFNGELTYENTPNSITGIMYNVTGGLIYKFNEY